MVKGTPRGHRAGLATLRSVALDDFGQTELNEIGQGPVHLLTLSPLLSERLEMCGGNHGILP